MYFWKKMFIERNKPDMSRDTNFKNLSVLKNCFDGYALKIT